MPEYRYQAIDKRGRNRNGSMPALDETDLQKKLKALGLWLTEAVIRQASLSATTTKKSKVSNLRLRGKRQRRELIDFCTVLTVQVREGVPQATAEDCKVPQFRVVIISLQKHIESGLEFHEALLFFPGVFSPHFVSLVRAGSATGKLPETLADLQKYLEWVEQVMGDVKQAALYPCIVLTVVAGFTLFLFTFIIPKFGELLDKLHVPKPMLTMAVMGAGHFAAATWWIWLPAILTVLVGLPLGRRLSPRFALEVDRLKLRLPVFGELNLMLALSRFSHNLAILYQSGIPILEALKQCEHGLIGNAFVEAAVGKVATDVKVGATISEALGRQHVFSSMLVRMVSLGETTGHLDTTLATVAEYYNDIIPRRIKALFSVIEPAIMLFIIGLVGVVALAIYLPILSLMGSIR
jgi:type IV pilus assembly protein PilC